MANLTSSRSHDQNVNLADRQSPPPPRLSKLTWRKLGCYLLLLVTALQCSSAKADVTYTDSTIPTTDIVTGTGEGGVGNVTFNISASKSVSYDYTMSGNGNVSLVGGNSSSSQLTLTNKNTYSGTTTINTATLKLTCENALANSQNVTHSKNAVMIVTENQAFNHHSFYGKIYGESNNDITLTLNGGGTIFASSSITDKVTGAATEGNLGKINLKVTGDTKIESALGHTGKTEITDTGKITLLACSDEESEQYYKGSLNSSSEIINNGTLTIEPQLTVIKDALMGWDDEKQQWYTIPSTSFDEESNEVTLNNLSGNGIITTFSNENIYPNAQLTLTVNNTKDTEFTGKLAANSKNASQYKLNLVKTGDADLTLTNGASTFVGGTTIEEGAIILGASSTVDGSTITQGPLGTGTVTMNGGSLGTVAGTAEAQKEITLANPINIATAKEGKTANNAVFETAENSNLIITSTITSTDADSGLTKEGTGTLTLNSQSYTGETTVSEGTLALSTAGAINTSSKVTNNATITLANGANTLNNLNGTTTSATIATDATVSADNTLELKTSDADNSYAGTITGGTIVNKTGAGTLTLSGANTYTGGTTITGGTLKLITNDSGNNGTLGTGTVNITKTSDTSYGTLEFNYTNNATFSPKISGNGKLIKNGNGKLTLSGLFDFTGESSINSGTLALQINSSTTLNSSVFNINNGSTLSLERPGTDQREVRYYGTTFNFDANGGGTLALGDRNATAPRNYLNHIIKTAISIKTNGGSTNYITGNNGFNFDKAGITFDIAKGDSSNTNGDLVVSALLWNASGGITKKGAGTLTLSSANDYPTTTISEGTLKLTGNGTLGTGATTISSVATLEVNVADGQTRQLTWENSASNTITGSGRIVKSGYGDLKILTASAGQITAENFVVSSGRLDMKGFYNGNLEVEGGAIFSPGNSVGALTIEANGTTADGNFTMKAGSTLLWEIGTSANDTLTIADAHTYFEEGSILSIVLDSTNTKQYLPNETVTVQLPTGIQYKSNGGSWHTITSDEMGHLLDSYHFQFSSYDATTGILNLYVDPNAVPEPSTWALLILGFMGLIWYRRRSKPIR